MSHHVASRIVFVCTGNAGRSQIAAALCEKLVRDAGLPVVVRSAGVAPWERLHPMAVKLLGEHDVDVAGRSPKPVSAVLDQVNDWVVTIGEPARTQLPVPMPGRPALVHWDIADPADADGTPDSEAVFRRTMALIEARLPGLLVQVKRAQGDWRSRCRPGVGTGVWSRGKLDPAAHLPMVVQAGFVGIELDCFNGPIHFDYRDAHAAAELARVASDLGVEIWSVHEPREAEKAGSPDPVERQAAIDALRHTIDLAHRLGAAAIPSHTLCLAKDWGIAEQSLLTLADDLRASGAKLAIENTKRQADELVVAFHRLPADAFGFVLDTGHANMQGGNEVVQRVIRAVGDRMVSMHLNDNDGRQDLHYAPGSPGCTLDWSHVASELHRVNYQGCYLWELSTTLGGRSEDPAEVLARTMAVSSQWFHP